MRRAGRVSVVMVGLRVRRAVTGGVFHVAVAGPEIAMRRAKGLRYQPHQKRHCREGTEQRTQSCLARTHTRTLLNLPSPTQLLV